MTLDRVTLISTAYITRTDNIKNHFDEADCRFLEFLGAPDKSMYKLKPEQCTELVVKQNFRARTNGLKKTVCQ